MNQFFRQFSYILLTVMIIALANGDLMGAQKDKKSDKKKFVITEAQLQSHIMSFADRRESTLTRAEDPEGLFESVESASESVEEMRLLAERGMYLATRMPQLWGLFGDLWLTRWMNNPDLQTILSDVQQLSHGTASLTSVAEKLPEQIAKERKAAID